MKSDNLKVLLNIKIINFLYKTTKKMYRFIHKFITAFKALMFYLKWSITKRKKTYKDFFVNYGIINIKPYNFLRWKYGVCYFTGFIDKKKYFIKTSGELNTIIREKEAIITAYKNSFLKKHLTSINYIIDSNTEIVEELIVGESLSKIRMLDIVMKEEIISQLYEIYLNLKDCKIYHLDIRPENFIVSYQNGKPFIYLIDFGYALVDNKDVFYKLEKNDKTKSIIKKLGSNYAPKNGTLDDAYSMLLTMKFVCPSLLSDFPEIWKAINVEIGKDIIKI